MLKTSVFALLLSMGMAANASALTPSGQWTLKNASTASKDYSMRIDVDPGETYSDSGYAPSSVY